jgi:hypothetical protein
MIQQHKIQSNQMEIFFADVYIKDLGLNPLGIPGAIMWVVPQSWTKEIRWASCNEPHEPHTLHF